MKAYVLEKPHTVTVKELPVPVCGSDEVLIRITNIGVCGSDIHLFKGTYSGPFEYPMLFGHEWSGVVAEAGVDVTDVKVGDKVTGDCSCYCGECKNCSVDKNICEHIEKYGITIDGASAEYIVRRRRHIYVAPSALDQELICLSEPMAVASHILAKLNGINRGLKGKKVLILGGGPLGLASLLLLTKYYGCCDVDVFDVISERNRLAESLGAGIPDIENMAGTDMSNYNLLYRSTGYDVVLETTGNPRAFQRSLELANPLGVVGCIGMMPEVTIQQKMIVLKALTVTGSIGGTGEFPMVLDFLQQFGEDARKLISHRFPAASVNEAFAVSQNTADTMKIQLILSE